MPGFDQLHEIGNAHLIGLEQRNSKAIETDESPPRGEAEVVLRIIDPVGMPNHQPLGVNAFAGDDIDLVVTATPVLRMRNHWDSGRFRGTRAGRHEFAFVVRHGRRAGRYLDGAGFDTGLADTFFNFLDVDLGDLLNREVAKRIGVPFGLKVGAGRADHAHAGFLRKLGEKFRVAAEIHRTGIDKSLDPERLQFVHLIDCPCHAFRALELRCLGIQLPARKPDQHVLVNQRAAEFFRTRGPRRRLNLGQRHAASSLWSGSVNRSTRSIPILSNRLTRNLCTKDFSMGAARSTLRHALQRAPTIKPVEERGFAHHRYPRSRLLSQSS